MVPIQNNDQEMPVIHFIDDTGFETKPMEFSIPGSRSIRIEGVARGSDGSSAVCGRAFDGDGKGGGFISWIPPDRQNIITIQTFPYSPRDITIAPDGTTWTRGFEVANGTEWDRVVDRDKGVVRRFDKSGKQIGSYIPRHSIFPRIDSIAIQYGRLASNKNRIGWYVDLAHEYFELTFDGDRVSYEGSYPGVAPLTNLSGSSVPPDNTTDLTGLALMENGDVYVGAEHHGGGRPTLSQIYRLDRKNRSWIPVALPTNPDGTPVVKHPYILGGDGDRFALLGKAGIVFVRPSN